MAEFVDEIAGVHTPRELLAEVTGHGVERFKAVFIEFIDNRVGQLAGALCERLCGEFDRARFMPHVSLLYRSHLAASARDMTATQHSFVGIRMWFDTPVTIVRVRTTTPPGPTPVARRLRG